ncbi:MAG: nucleotidyl transferase AbiEii/AbiGii toxin family protein [Bacilli bacterium]|nr:nucleotidyl transferase AbiEii/AbiGii toxin family protein [Bacilli bacterium]
MKLHEEKNAFYDVILFTSRELKISPELVEKDYFTTIVLKKLNDKISGLLFKGGTSLSKCYDVIDRFSEDIDLTLDIEHFSQSKKRRANKLIIEVCDELGFNLQNREFLEKHSHSNYNVYNIEYPILFPSKAVKPFIKVEMVFIQKAYPDEIKQVYSLMGKVLIEKNNNLFSIDQDLIPFSIRVQSLERTFVDKVFAICDYYLRNEIERNSRHIYDLYRIYPNIKLDEKLKELISCVREDRKSNKNSISAQDDVNINSLLEEIINKEVYKDDYHNNTQLLLFKQISYEETINIIKIIIDSKAFL